MMKLILVLLACLSPLQGMPAGPEEPTEIYVRAAKRATAHEQNRCEVARTAREACGNQATVTEALCTKYGCCWDDTHQDLNNKCFRRGVAAAEYKPNEYVATVAFCDVGTYLLGDSNIDGFTDQLCLHNGTVKISRGAATDPYNNANIISVDLGTCANAGDQMLIGSRGELVCVKDNGGVTVWLADASSSTIYSAAHTWTDDEFNFCPSSNRKQLFLDDFSADGNSDLFCISNSNTRTLALGDSAGTFLDPKDDMNYLDFGTAANSVVYVRDQDADGRVDLICQLDGGNGGYEIALSDGDGLILGQDFLKGDAWCNAAGDTFILGDANGDHHDDWICHQSDGTVCVKYGSHIFAGSAMFAKEVCDPISWCKSPASVFRGDLNANGMDDIFCHETNGMVSVAKATVRPPVVDFVQVDWQSTTNFCADKELFAVDANGNGKQDVACHDHKGGLVQTTLGNPYGELVGPQWSDPSYRFCHKTHEHDAVPIVLTGDVDADGNTDLLCHYPLSGDMSWAQATSAGEYGAEQILKAGFCQGREARVFAGDLTGDGKVDVMCNQPTGYTILYRDSVGAEQVISSSTPWCEDVYDEVLPGRYSGGNKDEFMCHNQQTGALNLLGVDDALTVSTQAIPGYENWCLSTNSQNLLSGDFNKDKLWDFGCHSDDGKIKILENQGENKAHKGLFAEEFTTTLTFCAEPGSHLQTFDANGDGYFDMTCHTSNGKIQIAESHIVQTRSTTTAAGGPVAYYPMDSWDGLIYNQNIYIDTTPPANAIKDGKVNKSIELNKARYLEWIDLGNFTELHPDICIVKPDTCVEGGSVSLWIKANCTSPDYGGIVTSLGHTPDFLGTRGFNIDCYQTKIWGYIRHRDIVVYESIKMPEEVWFHYALAYNGTSNTVATYIDGVPVNNMITNNGGDRPENSGLVSIGRVHTDHSTYYFLGSVDELKFWDKTLTPAEVLAEVNAV